MKLERDALQNLGGNLKFVFLKVETHDTISLQRMVKIGRGGAGRNILKILGVLTWAV